MPITLVGTQANILLNPDEQYAASTGHKHG